MTTLTNEEVRRQFEAAMRERWREFRPERKPDSPHEYKKAAEQFAWIGYQAALSSPAVVALVEACKPLEELWVNDCDMDEPIQHVVAALAPFTTGAGHVE